MNRPGSRPPLHRGASRIALYGPQSTTTEPAGQRSAQHAPARPASTATGPAREGFLPLQLLIGHSVKVMADPISGQPAPSIYRFLIFSSYSSQLEKPIGRFGSSGCVRFWRINRMLICDTCCTSSIGEPSSRVPLKLIKDGL